MPDFDTLAGIYTYAMDHHGGQYSRLYRLMSRIRMTAPDSTLAAIQGNRHNRKEQNITPETWAEWERARVVYRKLKRRQAQ